VGIVVAINLMSCILKTIAVHDENPLVPE